MFGIKGYCILKSLDQVVIGLNPVIHRDEIEKLKSELLKNKILTIQDVAVNNSGFLCIVRDPDCLVDVRSMDSVHRYFLCDSMGDILLPPGLPEKQKFIEITKRVTRDGGYNTVIKNMVIAASLSKGEFYDDFLFTKR